MQWAQISSRKGVSGEEGRGIDIEVTSDRQDQSSETAFDGQGAPMAKA